MPSLYGDNLDAVVSGGEQVTADLGEALYLVTQGLAGKAPRVNATNNHWEVYDNGTQAWIDTGVNATGADGEDGHSPFLNSNGVWMVWDDTTGEYVNTGLHAQGQDGRNGYSPYINTQTNTWMYYDDATEEWYDSGVSAQGTPGAPGTPGTNGTDGYSPAVTITTITGGHRVTITDEDHPTGQSFDVMDGEDGSGSGDFVLLRLDANGYVYNGTTAITGTQINTLAASRKAVFLWDEDNDRLYTYTEPVLSAGLSDITAVFAMPWVNGKGSSIRVVNAADNDSTYYDRPTLPIVTSSDNGKVLGVVNGNWAVKTDDGGGGGSAPFEIPITQSGSTYSTTATAADILANRNNCVAIFGGDRISASYVDYSSSTKVSILFTYTVTVGNQLASFALIVSVDGGTVTVTRQAASSMVVPVPTSAESEGDFLRLDNNKIPVWQTVPSAESNSFGGGS